MSDAVETGPGLCCENGQEVYPREDTCGAGGVLFDLGGVLVKDIWENMLLDCHTGLAFRYNLDRTQTEKVGKILWEAFSYRSTTSCCSWQDLERFYWQLFSEFFWGDSPPRGVSVDRLIEMTDEFITPTDPVMLELVDGLRKRGTRLGICSNNNEFWYQRQVTKLGLDEFFDPANTVLSCRVGVSKSSPGFEMFETALDAMCLRPSECVFVDDRQRNIDRAAQFGLVGVLFEGTGNLQSTLGSLFQISSASK